jgi:hypothetical protein
MNTMPQEAVSLVVLFNFLPSVTPKTIINISVTVFPDHDPSCLD